MKVSATSAFAASLTAALLCVTVAKRGYILTSPKSFLPGSEAVLRLQLSHVNIDGHVTVRLVQSSSDNDLKPGPITFSSTGEIIQPSKVKKPSEKKVLSETRTAVTSKDAAATIRLNVPDKPGHQVQLEVNGTFGTEYSFNATKTITIASVNTRDTIFIETDKPTYKPGQTVKFRVLPINSHLKPLGESAVGEIWVETPDRVRVAQWKNVSFAPGMVQFENELTEDPPLGYWTIHVKISEKHESNRLFNVQKYVLPKFDVTITPPPYLLITEKFVKYTFCAKYTYGKPVNGDIKIEIDTDQYKWHGNDYRNDKITIKDKIKGCFNYTVDATKLIFNYTDDKTLGQIHLTVDVTEQGTGVTRSSSHYLHRTYNPAKISFYEVTHGHRNFRPGLPYKGMIEVKTPDSQPAPDEPVKLCLKLRYQRWSLEAESQIVSTDELKACKKYMTDKQGRAFFTIPPQPHAVIQIDMKAAAVKHKRKCNRRKASKINVPNTIVEPVSQLHVPETHSNLKSWFSPSGSQLYIEPSYREILCNEPHTVNFQYTVSQEKTTQFFYMVVSRKNIVQNGHVTDTFHADKDQSDYSDNSYVKSADGIHGRLDANSDTVWENSVVLPPFIGTVSFNITPTYYGNPSELVQLIVYYIRDDGEVVADWTVLKVQRCLENKVSLKFGAKEQSPGSEAALSLSASPSSLCGIGMVDKSVYLMSSNNRLKPDNVFSAIRIYPESYYPLPNTRSNNYCENKYANSSATYFSGDDFCDDRLVPSDYADTSDVFEKAGVTVMSDLTLEVTPCKLPGSGGSAYSEEIVVRPRVGNVRAYGRATVKTAKSASIAMTQSVVMESDHSDHSEVEVRNYFPETWLWDLEIVGSSGAVAITKPLPHTITEWVGNAVCISKDTGIGISDQAAITTFQPFFVSSNFPYSVVRGETVPINITVFSYLQRCVPILLVLEKSDDFLLVNGSLHVNLCLCGGESITYRYMVKPQTIGHVNATVHAYSNRNNTESICGNDVDHIQARDAATWKLLVEAEGYPQTETSNAFICVENNQDAATSFELKLPNNVVQGSARAYVSTAGDLMGPVMRDLGHLLRLPSGCGEQTLSSFAPQIFILDYLIASHRLTPSVKEKILHNLQVGYTRELTFRNNGHEEVGSYRMFNSEYEKSSIWLTAAVVRYFSQLRRHTFVDEQDLKKSVDWIVSKQQKNGCFPRIGSVPYSALSTYRSERTVDSNGTTYYSYKETPAPLTAYIMIALLEANFANKTVLDRGFDCLEAHTYPSAYEMALYAYAAVLSKNRPELAARHLKRLDEISTKKDGMQYWRGESMRSLSTRIETASYVALSYLNQTDIDLNKLTPIMRGIAKNMNPYGGFSSTQDTLVAVQAMAQFSTYTKIGPSGVNGTITGMNFKSSFNVNSENLLLVQSKPLKTLPNHLEIKAVGLGCVFVQAALFYNIISPPENQNGFYISAKATRGFSDDCKRSVLQLCAKFTNDYPSNMVIIEVRLLSGFEVDTSSLEALQNQPNVKLRKYEIKDGKVYLYFNELTSTMMCFDVTTTEVQQVSDLQPATVKIYDYYEQEKTVSASYALPKDCNLNVISASKTVMVPQKSTNEIIKVKKPRPSRDKRPG